MIKKILISTLLFSTILSAIMYENGATKDAKRWEIYNNISGATAKNIYDKGIKSRVISLKSSDIRTGFMLPLERNSSSWCKTNGKTLKWRMQTKSDFVMLVSVQTIYGHRYVVYTPSEDEMGGGYYGLGKESIDGSWHNFSRDLDADLNRYEIDNEIIAVDTLFIRGRDIKIDNIEIVSSKAVEKSKSDQKSKKSSKKSKKGCNTYIPTLGAKGGGLDGYDTTPPTIKLNGSSTVNIGVGDEYIEKGAIAIDNVDGRLDVEISGDIDSGRVGTYTLFYMAKDRAGNKSMVIRVINVQQSGGGFTGSNKAPAKKSTSSTNSRKEVHTIESVEYDTLESSIPEDDFNSLEELGIIED